MMTAEAHTPDPTDMNPAPGAPPAPFILGTSVYQMLDFSVVDVDWYMAQLKAAGGNAFEIFLHRSWPSRPSDGAPLGPQSCIYLKISETRDSHYPGVKFPVFDLDQWNEANVSKLQSIFVLASGYGLKVIVRIHDYFSRKTTKYRKSYPYDACLQAQGYQGAPGNIWLMDEAESDVSGRRPARWYLRRENDKLLEMARTAGADVYFCIMSEADYSPVTGVTKAELQRRVIAFHEFYYADLTSKGVDPGHILVSFQRGIDVMRADPLWKDAIFEIHGCNSPEVLQNYYRQYGPVNFFPNGDGLDPHASGLAGLIGTPTREPSVSQAKQMRALILANNGWGWCTWNRKVEKRWPADIRRANFNIIRALAGLS